MVLHLLKCWDNPSPTDYLPLLLILDDKGGRGENTIEGSLGQAIDRIQVVMQNRHAFFLQLRSDLFDSGTFWTFRFRKNFY